MDFYFANGSGRFPSHLLIRLLDDEIDLVELTGSNKIINFVQGRWHTNSNLYLIIILLPPSIIDQHYLRELVSLSGY